MKNLQSEILNPQSEIKVLIVEDNEDDAFIVVREFKRGGYAPVFERVETPGAMLAALERETWDIIIADYSLPKFSGLAALKLYKEKGLDMPFIIVSGTIGEEIAVGTMVAGAHDYLMKNNLSRLIPAVKRELHEADMRRDRRKMEQDLQKSLKELHLTDMRQKTLLKLYEMVDAKLEDITGFVVEECVRLSESEFAFIGFLDRNETSIHTYLWSQKAKEQCAIDGKPVMFPIEHAGLWAEPVRQRKPVIVNDYSNSNLYKKGYQEGHVSITRFMGLPIIERDHIVMVAGIANKKEAYNESDISHLKLLLDGMWSFIQRKKAEDIIAQSLERLQKATGGIIDVIVTTVEARDPYTSGHQKRVAKLADSIAVEMGLSQDQIEGVRMAGVIHDLGKFSVPAELLSKPFKLREVEFNLIKIHPETGYEILRDIEFPWPLAQIVLQHHERIDGSGYPQGLKGKEVLLEARILAVADVVEAIESHRPYRPANSIQDALDEISQNTGVLYDADAVEACLKLFKEKGFSFK